MLRSIAESAFKLSIAASIGSLGVYGAVRFVNFGYDCIRPWFDPSHPYYLYLDSLEKVRVHKPTEELLGKGIRGQDENIWYFPNRVKPWFTIIWPKIEILEGMRVDRLISDDWIDDQGRHWLRVFYCAQGQYKTALVYAEAQEVQGVYDYSYVIVDTPRENPVFVIDRNPPQTIRPIEEIVQSKETAKLELYR
jgi:hypothetical protein